MASVFGIIGNGFLCRRKFLHEQIINKIRKYTKVESSKTLKNTSTEVLETVSLLLDAQEVSKDLCFHVRNEMINKHIISEETADTQIVDLCLKSNKPQIAKSYVKCLESNGYSVNTYALIRYLNIYSTEDVLSESEQNEIIHIVERIKKEYEDLPLLLVKACVIALCKTYKWEMTMELIKDDYIFYKYPYLAILYIVPAAFRNGKISTGLTILNETNGLQYEGHSYDLLYREYLTYYVKNKPAELNTAIEKIFCLWRKHDIIPTKSIIDLFVNECNNAGWETKYVTIKREGKCCLCGNTLSAFAVNGINFRKLARDIISKALIDTDIFQNTTPIELKKFKDFIRKTKPYDIVIDGLNVAGGQRNSKWLKIIVDHFTKENKKILVIARQHLHPVTKWILPLKNVYIYFLENTTQDDLFILYATLESGSNSKFVTIDLLRQHFHKLKDEKIRRMFKRWQYTHQYTWVHDTSSNKSSLVEPWLYEPFAQYNNGYWHIPYRMDSEKKKLLSRPVDTWICCRFPKT